MKMTTGFGYGALSAELAVAKDMVFTSEVDCGDLTQDAVRYAVCRFLRKNPAACDRYVTMSYRLRFATGRDRRARRCRFTAPARAMELPGRRVVVTLSVDPGGVTVESVSIRRSAHESGAAA